MGLLSSKSRYSSVTVPLSRPALMFSTTVPTFGMMSSSSSTLPLLSSFDPYSESNIEPYSEADSDSESDFATPLLSSG